MFDEVGREPVQRSVRRVGAVNRTEAWTIVIQRLRYAIDQRLVFLDQPDVSLSYRRIHGLAIDVDRDEEMLDHAVGTQQLDAIQKQLRIGRDALADRVC